VTRRFCVWGVGAHLVQPLNNRLYFRWSAPSLHHNRLRLAHSRPDALTLTLTPEFPYGGARWNAMRGSSGVASDNRQDSNPLRLGASAEGRLAWPQAPSPSGHLCKPTRPQDPRVAFRRAPPTDREHARRKPASGDKVCAA